MAVSRIVSWIRLCPERVSAKIDEALAATFYIVHQTGPVGFVLKQEGAAKKIKVYLGNPHVCSCTDFKKNHELCSHILWILLKKFRVPRTNPLMWQLAFVEREIDEIIHGYSHRQQPIQSDSCPKSHDNDQSSHTVPRRKVGPDDVCPICMEDLLGSPAQPLVYCQFGCGQNIHVKCMKIMASHQKSLPGDHLVHCPLCRVCFGPIRAERTLIQQRLCTEKPSLHLGATCSHCRMSPIAGTCYQCSTCVTYHLCHGCFSSNQVHLLHSFRCRKHPKQQWRPVNRLSAQSAQPSSSTSLPSALVTSLQSRSLTESDYEVLLQLDGFSPQPDSNSTTARGRNSSLAVSEGIVSSLRVEPLDSNHPLIVSRLCCQLCGGAYQRGDWVKKLPCKHKFHRECVHEWLKENSACPVDGKPVQTQTTKRLTAGSGKRRDSGKQTGVTPLTRALAGQRSVCSSVSDRHAHNPSVGGLNESTVLEVTNFTLPSHSIGRCKAAVPPNKSSTRSRNPQATSGLALTPLSRSPQSLRKITYQTVPPFLPDPSTVAVTSLTMQKQAKTTFKEPSFRVSSIPCSGSTGMTHGSHHNLQTPSDVNEGGQRSVSFASSQGTGTSPCTRSRQWSVVCHTEEPVGRKLADYISFSRSPLHCTSVSSAGVGSCQDKDTEKKFVSFPSLPVSGQRQGVKKGVGGRVVRGSLCHTTHSFPKIARKQLDQSLQVSSLKLSPLSLTNSMMAASPIKLDTR